jgi:hypothetical protein
VAQASDTIFKLFCDLFIQVCDLPRLGGSAYFSCVIGIEKEIYFKQRANLPTIDSLLRGSPIGRVFSTFKPLGRAR